MTTPRDLLITTLDVASSHLPEQGDLSLALAGGELIDLLNARAAGLDGDRVVPDGSGAVDDHLLNEASAALARQAPYESVEDWLWRRGRGLAAVYLAALKSEGEITWRRRSRWAPFGSSRAVLTDTPARRSARERRTSDEPVLASLGTAIGIRDQERRQDQRDQRLESPPDVADEAVETVLATVHNAVRDLEAERQRRSIEDAAFDNIWRGQ
ncbi:GPP34 family phosphoprotein [Streptomyces sp. IB2014 016-6]|uniref:GOLPH3/VPS74 family protein n=1 Tax=Streptomyces sp. IB2014 016-6 TaxID=2517818 RepID=UPI0011CB605A|nr:GPP34 family phosphoprotein [Streptomyces sp. IB2014 016-6]TXL87971.1 GPP34 family phosphoprotein [Streptomyces sp. IB2014 016-6]